jgi:RNA polymerase sigma-70 factor (ECF subfamily)
LTPELVRVLVDNHARFLAFLERRVGRREVAEEILQEAFVRGLDKGGSLREAESVTAWFYRLLRNALVDHLRRRGTEQRAMELAAHEPSEDEPAPDEALMGTVCGCVRGLIDTLKPEYAAAIKRVDLDGMSVQAFAAEAGISANNAGVRLHRAREALHRQLVKSCGTCTEHGCLECTCEVREGKKGGAEG